MKKIILILCLLLSNITYSQVDYDYDVDSDDYCGNYYADLITKDLIAKYFEDKGVHLILLVIMVTRQVIIL
jgi:hypothetical protein